jgi:hypothetical protein
MLVGKSDSVAELYGLVNAVLDGSMGSHDLALGLQKFELMEAVDATVTAIEDRLLSQDTGKASMMATLSVHRAVATILQQIACRSSSRKGNSVLRNCRTNGKRRQQSGLRTRTRLTRSRQLSVADTHDVLGIEPRER